MVHSVLCLLTVALAFVPLLSARKEKPGVCPKPRAPIDPTDRCTDWCFSDGECRGNLKCCFDGCRRVCLKPKGGPKPKPGSCPRPIPHFNKCKEECTDDRQCPKNLKCCYSNCGFQCVPPEHV
ncbi:hypothetical protein NQD34_005584 [Periophthalmus magnuspinnatus]|nr:hypothetical protein NQD34_005584 [Periophthalmus magnuspinnatus]